MSQPIHPSPVFDECVPAPGQPCDEPALWLLTLARDGQKPFQEPLCLRHVRDRMHGIFEHPEGVVFQFCTITEARSVKDAGRSINLAEWAMQHGRPVEAHRLVELALDAQAEERELAARREADPGLVLTLDPARARHRSRERRVIVRQVIAETQSDVFVCQERPNVEGGLYRKRCVNSGQAVELLESLQTVDFPAWIEDTDGHEICR